MTELWMPKPAVEELDQKQILKLSYNALRISRGNGAVMDVIEHYLGFVYYGQVNGELLETARPALEAAASKQYLGSNHAPVAHKTPDQKKEEVTQVVNGFFSNWYETANRSVAHINTDSLTRGLFNGDLRWLPKKRQQWAPDRALGDKPFTSQLLSYGVLRRNTGVEDFNEMYRLAAAQMLQWASPETDTDDAPGIFQKEIGAIVVEHIRSNAEDKKSLRAAAPDLFPRTKLLGLI